MNHLHERCLCVIYNNTISSFKELLDKDWSVLIHNRNLQTLALCEMCTDTEFFLVRVFPHSDWIRRDTIFGRFSHSVAIEMFKVYSNIGPPIFTEIFNKWNRNYQLRHTLHFSVPPVRLSFIGPKIWDIVPTELKEVKTLSAFKSGIKKWWPQNCPCGLCKRYLPNIGFI